MKWEELRLRIYPICPRISKSAKRICEKHGGVIVMSLLASMAQVSHVRLPLVGPPGADVSVPSVVRIVSVSRPRLALSTRKANKLRGIQ